MRYSEIGVASPPEAANSAVAIERRESARKHRGELIAEESTAVADAGAE